MLISKKSVISLCIYCKDSFVFIWHFLNYYVFIMIESYTKLVLIIIQSSSQIGGTMGKVYIVSKILYFFLKSPVEYVSCKRNNSLCSNLLLKYPNCFKNFLDESVNFVRFDIIDWKLKLIWLIVIMYFIDLNNYL